MSLASPPGRVTLADFRQMQALLLETRQQLEDSRDRERVAREELQQRPVLPDPASFPKYSDCSGLHFFVGGRPPPEKFG